MKIKTSELTGAALDWAVAETEGGKRLLTTERRFGIDVPIKRIPPFSTSWNVGGPLIEKHKIDVIHRSTRNEWAGILPNASGQNYSDSRSGRTPLIAAMRALVAAKLGDEIEVPDELVKETA